MVAIVNIMMKVRIIKIITIIVIIIIINYFYKLIFVVIIIGKSYSHQEKGVKNYKSNLTINTQVH